MAVNMARLDELIEIGEHVVTTAQTRRGFVDTYIFVNGEAFTQWQTSCLTFIEVTYSRNILYYERFVERCDSENLVATKAGIAILRAMKDDIGAEIRPTATIDISALPLHPRIAEVSLDLYVDGHYAEAVLEASKSLINYVKERSRREDLDGAGLMTTVFSKDNAILAFNDLTSQTDFDEQQGLMHLFQGAVLAIRNPRGHDFPDDSPERAMEYISFISMLANLVHESRKV